MSFIDLIDETFVVADRAELARIFVDPARPRAWWPELDLRVHQDRGLEGVRWTVAGDLSGTSEVWLEEYGDGAIVHYFLRADPVTVPRWPGCSGDRLRHGYTVRWKAIIADVKVEVEAGRQVGM